jgi:rubrerythrin
MDFDEKQTSDAIILRQAIIAELDAISLYERMSRSAKNPKLKKLLLDIAEEEKVHVGEFEQMLEQTDKEHAPAITKGKSEAKNFKEWLERKRS